MFCDSKTGMKKIFFIGSFPPPHTGLSAATEAIYDRVQAMEIPVIKTDTSPPDLRAGMFRLRRIPKILFAWFRLLISGWKEILYLPLSGRLGQIYDIVTVGLARIMGMKIFLHHHSTAYLDQKRLITKVLFAVAGNNAVHIALCETMQNALVQKYKRERVILLSNLALFPSLESKAERKKCKTIGFLSNITAEKGGFEIVRLANAIKDQYLPLQVVIAGPSLEPTLTQALQDGVHDDILDWRGAIYNKEKEQFWNDIDVFIFPTKYRNEAEPLVVWEALSFGVPVIVYKRGCISNQVGQAGIIIEQENDFVDNTLKMLEEWIANPQTFQNVIIESKEQYRNMHGKAEKQWQTFFDLLTKEF